MDNTKLNWDFLQAALGLHLITERQLIEMQELLNKNQGECDLPEIMVERHLISVEQRNSIFDILAQAVSFAGSMRASFQQDKKTDKQEEDTLTSLFEPVEVIGNNDDQQQAHSTNLPGNNDRDMSYAHYTIVGTIGVGGLGRVLRGMDRSLQREVAIKEIVDDRLTHLDKRLLARFLNEARITGQLQHPGIVPVYQIGAKENGGLFYVMKYVRGRTLEEDRKSVV